MKIIYRISLFFNFCCICFLLIRGTEFYYRNYAAMPPVKEEFQKSSRVGRNAVEHLSVKNDMQEEITEEDITTAGKQLPVTNCDTVFVIKEHDYRTGEVKSHKEKLPALYVGKTREELESLLIDYSLAPDLTDQQMGFDEVTLDSFSSNKVVATKYYTSKPEEEDFYLMAEDNYISVYCADLKTVYLYTGISMAQLPLALQQEILDKKHIHGKAELYNFLESYSS